MSGNAHGVTGSNINDVIVHDAWIDARLRDTRRGSAVAALAELFDDATNTLRTLASDLRISLPAELFGSGC